MTPCAPVGVKNNSYIPNIPVNLQQQTGVHRGDARGAGGGVRLQFVVRSPGPQLAGGGGAEHVMEARAQVIP